MVKRKDLAFKPPQPGEVRRSGWAIVGSGSGYTVKETSCSICAAVLEVPWEAALFEGECRGCEVPLSGNPVEV